MTASETLTALSGWIRSAAPTVESTEYVDIDTYVEVNSTQYLDLGIAGEVEVDVRIDEYNVELSDYEVEVGVEVDVENLIRDESPVELSDVYDALEAAVAALDASGSAVLPAAVDTTESTAARAALAAVRSFLDGYGSDAVIRSLGTALSLAGYGSAVEVETETVELTVPLADLRLGDIIIEPGQSWDGSTVTRIESDRRRVEFVRPSRTGGLDGNGLDAFSDTSRSFRVRRSTSTAATPETVSGVRTDALRPGDIIRRNESEGGGSNADAVIGSTVVSTRSTDADLWSVTVTLPSGFRDDYRFNSYRKWTVERSTSTAGYDPLTVLVSVTSISCRTRDLRLGDDVTGRPFGRLVRIEREGGSLVLVLNRDGTENRVATTEDGSWQILPVAPVDLDRSSIPAALDALVAAV